MNDLSGLFDGDQIGGGDEVVEKDEAITQRVECEVSKSGHKTASNHDKNCENDGSGGGFP